MIFNRPAATAAVVRAIAKLEPKFLYIAADGARSHIEQDTENCRLAKQIIETEIKWNCEVKKLYRLQNLGCKKAVSSAITWFFQHVESGIILEDDTVPNSSFFSYAANALNKYDRHLSVMHVSGTNFRAARSRNLSKPFFSKYPQVWGWATWKRAWENYDVSMADWPAFNNSKQFKNWCLHKTEREYWTKIFDSVYNGNIDTWDYQWVYTMIKNNGLSLVPAKNMVTNIGFNADATHTKIYDANFANLPAYEYNSLKDKSPQLSANKKADEWVFNNVYNKSKKHNAHSSLIKIRNKITKLSKSLGI
jgi:hypothetical protein